MQLTRREILEAAMIGAAATAAGSWVNDGHAIRFGEIVNGKCMRLKYSGVDLWRVASA